MIPILYNDGVLFTSLKRLKEMNVCGDWYRKSWALARSIDRKWTEDRPISLMDVLRIMGVNDCLWTLRATLEPVGQSAGEIAVGMVESVEPLCAEVEESLEATRGYLAGSIPPDVVDDLAVAAYNAGSPSSMRGSVAYAVGLAGRAAVLKDVTIASDILVEIARLTPYAASMAAGNAPIDARNGMEAAMIAASRMNRAYQSEMEKQKQIISRVLLGKDSVQELPGRFVAIGGMA